MLKGEIKEGEVYTRQELEALGLSDGDFILHLLLVWFWNAEVVAC
jgi:hypothetical protein